jgi:hypothetical protein
VKNLLLFIIIDLSLLIHLAKVCVCARRDAGDWEKRTMSEK